MAFAFNYEQKLAFFECFDQLVGDSCTSKIPKNADFPKFCEYGSIFNEKTKNEEGLEAENLDFKADVL